MLALQRAALAALLHASVDVDRVRRLLECRSAISAELKEQCLQWSQRVCAAAVDVEKHGGLAMRLVPADRGAEEARARAQLHLQRAHAVRGLRLAEQQTDGEASIGRACARAVAQSAALAASRERRHLRSVHGHETAPQTMILVHARDESSERSLVCSARQHVDDDPPCAPATRIVTRREPVRRVLQAHAAEKLVDGWLQVLQLLLLRRRARELQELRHVVALWTAHERIRLSPCNGRGQRAAAHECRRSGESGGEISLVVEFEVQTAMRRLREHVAETLRQLWHPRSHHRERSGTICRWHREQRMQLRKSSGVACREARCVQDEAACRLPEVPASEAGGDDGLRSIRSIHLHRIRRDSSSIMLCIVCGRARRIVLALGESGSESGGHGCERSGRRQESGRDSTSVDTSNMRRSSSMRMCWHSKSRRRRCGSVDVRGSSRVLRRSEGERSSSRRSSSTSDRDSTGRHGLSSSTCNRRDTLLHTRGS